MLLDFLFSTDILNDMGNFSSLVLEIFTDLVTYANVSLFNNFCSRLDRLLRRRFLCLNYDLIQNFGCNLDRMIGL